METPDLSNGSRFGHSGESTNPLVGWDISNIRELISPEGRKSFLDSNHDERSLDWAKRYNQLLLTDTDALITTKNLVKTAQNANVADRAHIFVDLDYLQALYDEAYDKGETIRLELPKNQEVEIPLGMFVSAESFESWQGRPEGVLKDGRLSNEVIEQYAMMDSEPPAVEDLEGYLLPDGRIYFKSKNSHRVAAAIRRGDKNVKFSGSLSLAVLNQNPEKL